MLARNVKEILADGALIYPPTGRDVTLKEKNVMTVIVAGLPKDATVINLNRIGKLSGIQDGIWKRACDYLIVFHDGAQDGALFVELKKTLGGGGTDGREQLRRSLPILSYLQTMCALHFPTDAPPATARYALIAERGSPRLDKQPVRASNTPQVEEYKNIRVVSVIGERVAFDSLARG